MIDIELLKEGQTVWVLHENRIVSFVSCGIHKLHTASGTQINIKGAIYSFPADHCYSSEMELIEAQIEYWRDRRLFAISKGMPPNCS